MPLDVNEYSEEHCGQLTVEIINVDLDDQRPQ